MTVEQQTAPNPQANAKGTNAKRAAASKPFSEKAVESVTSAYDATIDRARGAVKSVGARADSNPISLLVGGAALGALVGSVVPRLAREKELLGPVGQRLAETATATIDAVKEAGRAEIEGFIPTRDNARDHIQKAFGNVLDAAKGSSRS